VNGSRRRFGVRTIVARLPPARWAASAGARSIVVTIFALTRRNVPQPAKQSRSGASAPAVSRIGPRSSEKWNRKGRPP